MKAYSRDIREKVIKALESGKSNREVAENFGISRKTVWEYSKRYKQRGEVYYKQHGGHRKSKFDPHKKQVVHWLKQKPEMTLKQLSLKLQKQCQVKLTLRTLHYHLKKMNFSYKKNATGKRAWAH
ncbi:MAG: IS630 transposase-related protein [Verrucomicrobiota bacterium]